MCVFTSSSSFYIRDSIIWRAVPHGNVFTARLSIVKSFNESLTSIKDWQRFTFHREIKANVKVSRHPTSFISEIYWTVTIRWMSAKRNMRVKWLWNVCVSVAHSAEFAISVHASQMHLVWVEAGRWEILDICRSFVRCSSMEMPREIKLFERKCLSRKFMTWKMVFKEHRTD